ncbi:unnamed protein product, partial [Aphanomyces euteiches]
MRVNQVVKLLLPSVRRPVGVDENISDLDTFEAWVTAPTPQKEVTVKVVLQELDGCRTLPENEQFLVTDDTIATSDGKRAT